MLFGLHMIIKITHIKLTDIKETYKDIKDTNSLVTQSDILPVLLKGDCLSKRFYELGILTLCQKVSKIHVISTRTDEKSKTYYLSDK